MKLVAALSVLCLWAASAGAICPYPTPKVCSYYFEHDAVFVGKVLSSSWGDEYIRFRVQVSRVLRGRVGSIVAVYTGNDSARLQWSVGKTYVMFAERRSGRLQGSNDCGPLSDPDKVEDTVRQVAELKQAKGAAVEGEVLDTEAVGNGVAGVPVRVADARGVLHEARSDERGRFRLELPPGRYRMVLDSGRVSQSDYNWTDIANMALVKGQCAQIQLVAR